MTRIIAGFAGSLRLRVPTSGTRPTSDRVRESVLASLEARGAFDGARVLDLYAGSGALGLEAVSRGAASAVLVERAPRAAEVARANAALVRAAAPKSAAPEVRVVAQSVRAFLLNATGPFDLVFLDPPYDVTDETLAADLDALVPLLAEDATVVVERGGPGAPRAPASFGEPRTKRFGDTAVHVYDPA